MAHDIKIYGEIVPFQEKWITDQGGYVNLTVVQEQLKEANGKDIRVRIKSYGGDVEEGFSIYSELRRYAKEHNAKVTTLAEGQCASIATVFFLAGDERLVTEFTQPFVHNAWTYAMGDAKQLTRITADLETCNDMIAKHYANHTDLTYDEARQLMDDETYINPEECVRLRFATAIEEVYRPAAKLQIINKSNTNVKMAKNSKKIQTKNQNSEKSFINKLRDIFNKDVFTADNQVIDFYELEDNDTVKVGDKATIDGQPADGEVVIANGDKYIFEAGELKEIIEAAPEGKKAEEGADGESGEEDEVQVLKDRIAELEAENEQKDDRIDELEDLLEKATNKIDAQANSLKKYKDATSRDAGDQRKENKGNGGKETKTQTSESVKNFKQAKFKKQ